MVKASIDYLFTDRRSVKPTREWAELLRASKDKYANCRVVSLTRVKDLNSVWKHEYVQFVVEETGSKDRARVYAERGNKTNLDWVTFGPIETKVTGSKHDEDLPLPLTSLIFGGESGEDVAKRPTVLEIAEILAATTLVGGAYSDWGHHCFWYAYTAYDATKRQFGKWAKEKRWRWGDIGGAGNAGIKDAIGLGWSTLFKFLYVGHAKKFKEERETGMVLFGDMRPIIDDLYLVEQVTSYLEQPGNQDEFISAMKTEGFELTEAEIKERLQASHSLAEQHAESDANWTNELYELNKDLVERTNNDADAQKYLELYQSFEVPFDMNEVTAEGAGNYETKKALEIAVGHILEEALKHQ
ncbi:hypothetical protein B0J15DRAFT_566502 [Fusarium solani]|uniref:Uncharacterized protein n=1 Tax=Fusarium solani TaxID=169388 RepID=A0A9P9L312_FUSSL|nr:uncharacterized protein B0J15DRAFT_566502 [Fusarium solani]KAH7273313.1 hypothetical protein B0J15DRAFT_566502 [Fusarium solani]